MVSMEAGTSICHHATVDGRTRIGRNNVVHPYAYVGAPTHDLKYTGGNPGLAIGDGNVFREYCTVHVATNADGETVVGDGNVFLAYAHVAHDCTVGNHVVMSSQAALGGHVSIGDCANIGWSVGIHQFCRVGQYAMVGASSKATKDIPPYMLADGCPAKIYGPNFVNLHRHDFSEDRISQIKKIHRIFYGGGLNRSQAIEAARTENIPPELLEEFLHFIKDSVRGVA
jgi:UDP-N-acetylglucosamine acyltransferase